MQITIKVRSSHFLMLYVVYINRIAPSFRSRRYFSHHSKGCFLYLTAHRSRGRQTALVNSYRRFIMPLVRGQTNYICPLTCTIIALRRSVAPCLARRNSHKAGRTRNKSKNPRKTYVLHGQTVCSVCGTTVLESLSAFPSSAAITACPVT